MDFFSKTVVERSSTGTRQSISEQGYFSENLSSFSEYVFHVHVRQDNTAGVVICDAEYPSRVCFSLISKVLSFLSSSYGLVH